MADIPASLDWGIIKARVGAFWFDSADEGRVPDVKDFTGTVLIEPVVAIDGWDGWVHVPGDDGGMFEVADLECQIVGGVLMSPDGGGEGVPAVASVQSTMIPNVIQYRATFNIDGAKRNPRSRLFNVPGDGQVVRLEAQLGDEDTIAPYVKVVSSEDRVWAQVAATSAAGSAAAAKGDADRAEAAADRAEQVEATPVVGEDGKLLETVVPERLSPTQLSAQIGEAVTAAVPSAVAGAISDDPAVVEAAAQAALANQGIGITLTEEAAGGAPDPFASFVTVRGTPTIDTTPVKQGTGSLRGGAVLRTPLSVPAGERRTVEFYVRADAAPSGSTGDGAIRIVAFFADVANAGAVHYVAVNADGTIRVISGGNNTNNKATGPVIVGDSTFHHVAVVLYNAGTVRQVEAAYIDGVPLDGSLWSKTATGIIDTLFIGGLHTASQFDSLSSWHTDSVRISSGVRYASAFTPPTALSSDANTVALFNMDPQSTGSLSYPARPSVAGGKVTYVGTSEPTEWLTGDRWYKV